MGTDSVSTLVWSFCVYTEEITVDDASFNGMFSSLTYKLLRWIKLNWHIPIIFTSKFNKVFFGAIRWMSFIVRLKLRNQSATICIPFKRSSLIVINLNRLKLRLKIIALNRFRIGCLIKPESERINLPCYLRVKHLGVGSFTLFTYRIGFFLNCVLKHLFRVFNWFA